MYRKHRSSRKAEQRAIFARYLDRALSEVYHNATLGRFPDVPEELSEAAWEYLQFCYSCDLDEINRGTFSDPSYIEGYIAERYGKVYTYGRGGRTCAPEGWMAMRRRDTIKSADDFSELCYRDRVQLLVDVEAWNGYVKAECSSESIAAILGPWIEEKIAEKRAKLAAYARLCTI